MSCRLCGSSSLRSFLDLGASPLANSLITAENLQLPELHYPLHVYVCVECLLVQLPAHVAPDEIFEEYVYFTSFSETRLRTAEAFAREISPALGLGGQSLVVEIASNDGYLLQYFDRAGVPVLGIEPARNVAAEAQKKGIRTHVAFFTCALATSLAEEGVAADLIVANNVLAHVPELNDFVAGLATLLKPGGRITIEVPHLLQLIRNNQFDTIYHEHYSYFSLRTAEQALERHALRVVDVEQIPDQGGSLRLHVMHARSAPDTQPEAVRRIEGDERDLGLDGLDGHRGFAQRALAVKLDLLDFLLSAKRAGKTVAAYGAPAKGNTLLNYCGVNRDLISFTVDRSPHKQGQFLPGSRIPILSPDVVAERRPDLLLILPWNLREEIVAQMVDYRTAGGQFVVPIPTLEIIP